MKTDIWRQQTGDRDGKTERQRGEEEERQEARGSWRRREGDVSVRGKKEVSEDTGDSV